MTTAKHVEAKFAIRDKSIYACVLVSTDAKGVNLSPLYFGNDEESARERLSQYRAEYGNDGYQVILLKQID